MGEEEFEIEEEYGELDNEELREVLIDLYGNRGDTIEQALRDKEIDETNIKDVKIKKYWTAAERAARELDTLVSNLEKILRIY